MAFAHIDGHNYWQPGRIWLDPRTLPAYLMRSNGLMTNGLLPNNGWQG
jgi:hypothetical protein